MTISSSQSCPLKSKVPNSKFQRAKMAQNKVKQLVSVPHEFFYPINHYVILLFCGILSCAFVVMKQRQNGTLKAVCTFPNRK